jgi:predicted transcriptional regulator
LSDQTDTRAPETTNYRDLTVTIVSAYVANNSVEAGELPRLITSVGSALSALANPATEPASLALPPAVWLNRSVFPDYLISLEDEKRYRILKHHLARLSLTPAEYRAKWGLPSDYPTTAPSYSAKRSELAKSLGLGRKRNSGADEQDSAASDQAMAAEYRAQPCISASVFSMAEMLSSS